MEVVRPVRGEKMVPPLSPVHLRRARKEEGDQIGTRTGKEEAAVVNSWPGV